MKQYDIEYVIILLILGLFFLFGLNSRKPNERIFVLFGIDKEMSNAIRGIACVFVLMGHWATMRIVNNEFHLGGVISVVIYYLSANVALTWFVFFSGYGMSLKRISLNNCRTNWWKSVKKIYCPLLLVSVISVVYYAFLPDIYSIDGCRSLYLPDTIYQIHHLSSNYIIPILQQSVGWADWYVVCILIFYSIFYISSYLSNKYKWNVTLLLSLFLIGYYLFAFFYFGPSQAHYFRYVWVFMLGHAVARRTKLSWIMSGVLFFPLLFTESVYILIAYGVAVFALLLFSVVNFRYEMRSPFLFFIGVISYFFYLSHIRIGYSILTYSGKSSIIGWVILTILISYILYKIYNTKGLFRTKNIKK